MSNAYRLDMDGNINQAMLDDLMLWSISLPKEDYKRR